MGEEEFVATERPFHSMNAVERTRAKLRTCAASWRGWSEAREENMMDVVMIESLNDWMGVWCFSLSTQ